MKKFLFLVVVACSMFTTSLVKGQNTPDKKFIYSLGDDESKAAFGKIPKEISKQARAISKSGYKEYPGESTIERQLYQTSILRIKSDLQGNHRFLMTTELASAEDLIAGKHLAIMSAKLTLSGFISTSIAEILATEIDVSNISKSELASLTNLVSSSKGLIMQEITNLMVPFACYKELDNGYSSWITVAIDKQAVYAKTKLAIKEAMVNDADNLEPILNEVFEELTKKKYSELNQE